MRRASMALALVAAALSIPTAASAAPTLTLETKIVPIPKNLTKKAGATWSRPSICQRAARKPALPRRRSLVWRRQRTVPAEAERLHESALPKELRPRRTRLRPRFWLRSASNRVVELSGAISQ